MAVRTAYYDADLRLWRVNHPNGPHEYMTSKPEDAVEVSAEGVVVATSKGKGVALDGTYAQPSALTTKDLAGAAQTDPTQVAGQEDIDAHRAKLLGDTGATLDKPSTPDLVDAAHQVPEGGQPTQDLTPGGQTGEDATAKSEAAK